jgi:tetratricopeptide (TPR) repeat protein
METPPYQVTAEKIQGLIQGNDNTVTLVFEGGREQPVPFFYNVPRRPPRSLVGRASVVQQVKQRLFDGEDIALHGGLPGVGKTTVAVHLANDHEVVARFPDGVLWVSLGRTPAVMPLLNSWGVALGITPEDLAKSKDPAALGRTIRNALGRRRVLLVVDDAWGEDEALSFKVGGSDCVHLLTTRFENIANTFLGDSFSEGDLIPVQELHPDDGLTLLEEMAPAAVRERRLDAERCVKAVGGLPLALILVGNYLRRNSRPSRRLEQAFHTVLTAESRLRLELKLAPVDLPANWPAGLSPSLYAMIKLAEEPLDPDTRRTLRILTVFPPKANTFSREAAAAVSSSPEAVDGLWDYGLLELTSETDEQNEADGQDEADERYSMHQAISDYARESLTDKTAYRRMAEYLIEYIQRRLGAGTDETIFRSLELEQENIRAALEWAIQEGQAKTGLRLAGALWLFWYERSRFAEGRQWIDRLLALPGSNAPELAIYRAKVLNDAGNYAYNQADLPTASRLYEQSYDLRCSLNAEADVAGSLNNLSLIARARGDYLHAKKLLEQALAINHKVEQALPSDQKVRKRLWEAMNYNNLGLCALAEGNATAAAELQRISMAIFIELRSTWGIAMTGADLGSALLLQGDATGAADEYRKSLRLRHGLKDTKGMAIALRSLATLSLRKASFELAEMQYKAALSLSLDVSDKGGIADSLEGLANILIAKNQPDFAARLLAAADAFRRRVGIVIPPTAPLDHRGLLERLQQALPAGYLDDLLREGERDMPLEQVAREVLDGSPAAIEEAISVSLEEA